MANAGLLVIVAMLALLFGCASAPQQPPPQAPPQPSPAPNVTIQPQQPSPGLQPETAANVSAPQPAPQQAPSSACEVGFQRDDRGVYYVVVKTDSPARLTVACPDGSSAVKQGGLFFCSRLDLPSPVFAYLDGAQCGSGDFAAKLSGAAKPAGKQSCSLSLSSGRITAGDTVTVSVKAYSPTEGALLKYQCGNRTISEKFGGMVDSGKICQFDTPGTVEVLASIDGERCASGLVQVFAFPKECTVFGSSLERGKGGYDYAYAARVSGRGYSGSDLVQHSCFGEQYAKYVRDIQNSTDFIYTVECRGQSPLPSSVPVRISGALCGYLQANATSPG